MRAVKPRCRVTPVDGPVVFWWSIFGFSGGAFGRFGGVSRGMGKKRAGLADEPQAPPLQEIRTIGLRTFIYQCVTVGMARHLYTPARGGNSPWGTCVIPPEDASVCLTKCRRGGWKECGTPPAFGRRATWHQAVAGTAQTLSTRSSFTPFAACVKHSNALSR